MNKQREALLMALEWIEAQPEPRMIMGAETMRAIREALAEPEQKPVAYVNENYGIMRTNSGIDLPIGTKLYIAPPTRKPLTDEKIEQCMKEAYSTVRGRRLEHAFARAIERAHGIGGE